MREKKESAVKRNRTLITGSARVPPMWREYKQRFHPCGKSTVHLSERTGSWREGTLVPGSLPWAKARFFRGYDGVFKPSSFTVFCAPTREGAVIKARIYYGLWSPVVCTALLQSIKQKIKNNKRVLVCLVCASTETRLAAGVLARICTSAAHGLNIML